MFPCFSSLDMENSSLYFSGWLNHPGKQPWRGSLWFLTSSNISIVQSKHMIPGWNKCIQHVYNMYQHVFFGVFFFSDWPWKDAQDIWNDIFSGFILWGVVTTSHFLLVGHTLVGSQGSPIHVMYISNTIVYIYSTTTCLSCDKKHVVSCFPNEFSQ